MIQSRKCHITWWQEFQKRFPTNPLELRQENKRMCAPRVSHNFAVSTPLRQLKHTTLCWPFNNWRLTGTLPISISISGETRNCPNPSQRQSPLLTGSLRNSNCLKIFSKITENQQWTHGGGQNKILPLSHAWRSAATIQKHHQTQQREFGRFFDCDMWKTRKISISGCSETQI